MISITKSLHYGNMQIFCIE